MQLNHSATKPSALKAIDAFRASARVTTVHQIQQLLQKSPRIQLSKRILLLRPRHTENATQLSMSYSQHVCPSMHMTNKRFSFLANKELDELTWFGLQVNHLCNLAIFKSNWWFSTAPPINEP